MASTSRAVVILGKETTDKVIVWVAEHKGDDDTNGRGGGGGGGGGAVDLSYYQYHDEGSSFHHTICLLDSIANLTIVHTAALATTTTTPSKKKNKNKESVRLAKLENALRQSLVEQDVEAADQEQRPTESLVQSHGSIGVVNVQNVQPMVQNVLAADESAYLHFCGNVDFQHEPTLCAGLKLLLEQEQLLTQQPVRRTTIGPGTLLQSFLQIDATAADALLLWPPANAAQQFHTGGHVTTNSIYGLLAQSCCTTTGKQLLKKWLRQPLVAANEIAARHDCVAYWHDHSVARDAVRLEGLKRIGTTDLRKLAATLSTATTTTAAADGGQQQQPLSTRKALVALYDLYLVAWQKLPGVVEQLAAAAAETMPVVCHDIYTTLVTAVTNLQPAIQLVEAVLDMDQAPREYLVQADYQDDLHDVHGDLQNVQAEIQTCFAAMNEEWAKLSGSSATNQVRLEETTDGGLQFRLADTNSSKILQQTGYITVHRLLKNGVYFSTTELTELCSQRQDLRNEYDRLQQEVVEDAIKVAATYAVVLESAAGALANLDVLTGLAHTAAHRQYCRPVLLDSADQPVLELVGARHPCVELQEHVDFIPNDCTLGANGAFLLLTGPNMGGKSTYLRSLGSIVLLAQIGSFVPCTSAKLNICHHILARIGAGDWQERGISTFMAEMLESSRILKTATRRSLILIDELGRGTSTYDGYGLARSISEYILHKIGCLTIFATHFHELTSIPGVKNCHVTAQTTNGVLTFLYSVRPGPCLQSFGIAVAEMANVPASVIEDAKRRARTLEKFDVVDRLRRLPLEALTKSYGSAAEKKEAILALLMA